MAKNTFKLRDVDIPREIDGYEISKDPKGEILIQSPEHDQLKFHFINPGEWDYHTGRWSRGDLFLMEFGWQSYTPSTFVLLYASSFEEALEEAASYMKDEFPGVFIEFDEKDIEEARKSHAEEQGVPPEDISDEEAHDAVTVDHTYTESGYLASDQWHGQEASAIRPWGEKLKEIAVHIGKIVEPKDED